MAFLETTTGNITKAFDVRAYTNPETGEELLSLKVEITEGGRRPKYLVGDLKNDVLRGINFTKDTPPNILNGSTITITKGNLGGYIHGEGKQKKHVLKLDIWEANLALTGPAMATLFQAPQAQKDGK